jgi:hypothetical protein
MRKSDRLGDAPIEPKFVSMMNALAKGVDEILNGDEQPKVNGFILMVFPFNDHGGRCNYISNANRKDVTVMLKEQLARFEGQPNSRGNA